MPSIDSSNPGPRHSRLHALTRAFRHRNYRLYFFGQFLSLIGTWMQTIAQSWLVYRLTGSEALLGAVGFASQMPVFLFASLGGALADRLPRRNILLCTQAVSMLLALTLAWVTLGGAVQVWMVFVLAAGLGIANGFDIPARQSFIMQMVGRDDLGNAIALNSSIFNGARIVGPAVAGILVAAIGEGWVFFINGVSYVAVITAYLMMRITPLPPPESRGGVLAEIREAMGFVRHNLPVRSLLLLLACVSLAGMPYMVLMPIFADRVLHGGARALGLLTGSAGVGALLAALTLASRRSTRGLGSWVAYAAMGFGLSTLAFSYSREFWLSMLLLLPAGFFMMTQMASSNTLLQMMTPDALRGRVMALYTMMFMGMAPLGSLVSGSVAEIIGAPTTVAIGAVVTVCGALLFGRRLPAIRRGAHDLIVAQQMAAGQPAQAVTGRGIRRE